MSNVIYAIWGLIPLILLLMALWSYLEKVSGKKRQERPGDLFRQALFTALCVLVSIGIDLYFLPMLVDSILTDYIPYGVYQIILFPAVLFIAAKLIGPTKDITINKVTDTDKVYRKRRY